MNKKELRTLHVKELRVSKADDGSRSISGTVTYNTLSVDLGGFQEIIAPGAFAESLTGDVLCLRDHIPALLMGRTKSGTLKLADTADGLKFDCKLPGTTTASDLAESIDRGDLDGVSFGFICKNDKWAAADGGDVVRTVLAAELMEISPCSFAAYPANSVSVRSCPAEFRSKLKRNDQCQCACLECEDDNCADCSDPNCDDENCRCAHRSATLFESERNKLVMQIAVRLRK
jgi:HK97 family phage prohead protease